MQRGAQGQTAEAGGWQVRVIPSWAELYNGRGFGEWVKNWASTMNGYGWGGGGNKGETNDPEITQGNGGAEGLD